MTAGAPLLQAIDVRKSYGAVVALHGASISVEAGKVSCLLGDNGAGKSTFIKILSGVETPDSGVILMNGEPVTFGNPKAALDRGIATVFQDLAMVPIMPVFRNFFLGNEPTKGRGPLRRFDKKRAIEVTLQELDHIGIRLRDPRRPISTLSGGERQCVAIARAVHFGAKVLILDEPTSALGVRQAEIVLKYLVEVCRRGVAVVLVTHNPQHAYAVGDSFTIVKRGESSARWLKSEITLTELVMQMAGGEEFERLSSYLQANNAPAGQAQV
jgi:simple sugar transport system ATP-binding protein